MDEDQWIYDYIMSDEVNMNEYLNEEEVNAIENAHNSSIIIDCSDAFNTCEV